MNRYSAQGVEAEFEPGSRRRVLHNMLGIRSVREMQRRESAALLSTTQHMIDSVTLEQRFTADDILQVHRNWLGEIYPWAGEYRQVNIAKGDFMFAAAAQVPRLMQALEREVLATFTPCRVSTLQDQCRALAVVHVELILIHPFREGNGRCARLLSLLMGLQAGLPALDFGGIHGAEKHRYIAAVQAGMDRSYEPMMAVFRKVIQRTLREEASA
jgi:cell filamentation protein, protein adenylyltransferase